MTNILKWAVPPIFFFIIYFNVNFFIFSFEARQNYLKKRIKRVEGEISRIEKDLKILAKNKDNKSFQEMSQEIRDFNKVVKIDTKGDEKLINVYYELNKNKLSLISEEPLTAPIYKNGESQKLNKYTITGTYQSVITFLESLQNTNSVPVNFSLSKPKNMNTRYSITIWNKGNDY